MLAAVLATRHGELSCQVTQSLLREWLGKSRRPDTHTSLADSHDYLELIRQTCRMAEALPRVDTEGNGSNDGHVTARLIGECL